MVGGLIAWAFAQDNVRTIEAETTPDNVGSVRVLTHYDFQQIGSGSEPGAIRYALRRGASPMR